MLEDKIIIYITAIMKAVENIFKVMANLRGAEFFQEFKTMCSQYNGLNKILKINWSLLFTIIFLYICKDVIKYNRKYLETHQDRCTELNEGKIKKNYIIPFLFKMKNLYVNGILVI